MNDRWSVSVIRTGRSYLIVRGDNTFVVKAVGDYGVRWMYVTEHEPSKYFIQELFANNERKESNKE